MGIETLGRISKSRLTLVLVLFTLTFLFRVPTLFNDYYDVDELAAIVQTLEYIAGDEPGVDFKESKLPLYHAIFKFSYMISYDYGYVIVHIITMLLIFLTSLFVYLTGNILGHARAGVLGAVLYSILISSFNRQFMATNGEIVFNLPVAGGLYFFICMLKSLRFGADEGSAGKSTNPGSHRSALKIIAYAVLAAAMGIAAALVKVQGLIFLVFAAVFFILYYPYYNYGLKTGYFKALLILASGFFVVFIIDYISLQYFSSGLILFLKKKLYYTSVRGFNPFIFLVKYVHRQGLLALWHMVLWVPLLFYIIKFVKRGFKSDTLEESSVVLLFILCYLMILAGGIRLYFHYFIAVYPFLALLASIAILDIDFEVAANLRERLAQRIKEGLLLFILVPSLFFFSWNVKDIVLKHFSPQGFYNEGTVLYWTRAALAGSLNHYLLPGATYKDVCTYIKSNTVHGDRIFVWGDGPYLNYFSERRMGGKHLWPKNTITKITALYEKGDLASFESAGRLEKRFIEIIDRKKPVLFIDTHENGLTNFKFPVTPDLAKYIKKNYSFEKEISKMKIYRRI